MKFKQIDSFNIGDTIKGFFLCEHKYLKNTRLGDPYIDLIVSDSSGVIRCKIWKNVHYYNKKFELGMAVAIKGVIINFNNEKEIDIKNISSIQDSEFAIYGFNKNLLVKTIKESTAELWKNIEKNINTLSPQNKKFSKNIYNKYKNKLIDMPAIEPRYRMRGGYVKKISNILSINDKLMKLYNSLDNDKIVLGILFKEIGCIDYFKNDFIFSISKSGKLLDTASLGINFLSNEIQKKHKLDEDIELFLKHVVSIKEESADLEAKYIQIIFQLDLNFNEKNCKDN